MERIRVLIVDDHLVVRRGLRSMLAGADDVEVVGEAADAREAVEQIALLQPDVVLLDIRLPGMDGLRLLRVLNEKQTQPKIIILTHYDQEQFLAEAFRAGAYGYLLKNVGRDELLGALRTVHSGQRLLSPELMDHVLKRFSDLCHRQALDHYGLSDKEIELLGLVARGVTNREIAERLYWSETTVKRKLSDVFEKLNVADRAQAVAVAVRQGFI